MRPFHAPFRAISWEFQSKIFHQYLSSLRAAFAAASLTVSAPRFAVLRPLQAEQNHAALVARLRTLEQENAHLRKELQTRPPALPPPVSSRAHSEPTADAADAGPARDGAPAALAATYTSPRRSTPRASPSLPTLFSLNPGKRQTGDWGSDEGDSSPRAIPRARAPPPPHGSLRSAILF